ncbi:MAG: chromosome segregation protein SMC [Vampirovibrionales bacterium]|nr:chromosome segregation protein SMC [Vampirovibrionales bacterium]
MSYPTHLERHPVIAAETSSEARSLLADDTPAEALQEPNNPFVPRMFIREIEVDNFKSFQGKATIPFFPGFTTVSGPNGSGKSNIIDSILFCLGLSTSRTLRAEKLTDLINHHTKRQDAMVKITFIMNDDPNQKDPIASAQTVDTPLADSKNAPDNTLSVARRIKASKAGYSSTYYLNDHPATLGEVHERLAKYRVSPGCYNVMMQGDVAGIVNMSALERRRIIDELAGIAEFDRKIDQAGAELATTTQNIERTEILRAEIADRLAQLAGERDKALKYQALKDEKLSAESQLDWIKLRDLQRGQATTQENLANSQKEQAIKRKAQKQIIQDIAETRAQLLAISEEIRRKGEDQQLAVKKQIEGLKGHIARKVDTIRSAEAQQTENRHILDQLKSDEIRLQEAIAAIDETVAQLNHQLSQLESQYEAEEANYQNKLNALEGFSNAQSPQTQHLNELRKTVQLATDELAELNRQKLDFEAELLRLQEGFRFQQQVMGQHAEQCAVREKRLSELSGLIEALSHQKHDQDTELTEQSAAYNRLQAQLKSLQSEFSKAQQTLTQQESRKRALEEAGVFSRAVETLLDAGLGGVHGTLGQLMSFEADVAVAIETALGARVQNVVVDDDAVAQRCIEFLKQKRAGRATFLPINKLQRARSLPLLPRAEGVFDFAINLIRYDAVYDDAMAYALGETLVMEDLVSARKLLQKYRMVTLDGESLEKSGAMTGGQNANAGERGFAKVMLQRQQLDATILEHQKTVRQLQKEGEQAARQTQTIQQSLETLRIEQTTTAEKLAALEAEFATLKSQAQSASALKSQKEDKLSQVLTPEAYEAQCAKLNFQIEAVVRHLGKKAQALDGLHQQMSQLEAEVLSGPSQQLEALRKAVTDTKFQVDYIDTQRRNVDSDLKAKGIERHYHNVGLSDHSERREKLLKQTIELEQQKSLAQDEIQASQTQMASLEAQTAQLSQAYQQLQNERDSIQSTLLQLENQKANTERQLNQLSEQQAAFEARLRELQPEIESLKSSLARAMAERGVLEPEAMEALPEVATLQKNIESLGRKMAALEPVNMLAVEAYQEAETRSATLTDKVATLQQEVDALTLKIASYETLKRRHFLQSFDQVNTHFQSIFSELSDGFGQLVLTDPEQPLNGGLTIEAQPRGKKLQRLEAMSGGEKSLTSLAFVFSLQRAMPAPFYALDEVDMNLDGLNVDKLAKLIRREADGAQFIVVSLRKPMLEQSDRTVGVTQKPGGMTKITGIAWTKAHTKSA